MVMSRFLSAEWFDDVCREQAEPRLPPTLTLQQVVTGAPWGEIRYQVLVGESGARIEPGASDHPDVTFTSDYSTASAIARGRLSVQAALSCGRIRIGGDTTRLMVNHPLLGVDPVPAVVRAATTWDDGGDGGDGGGMSYG